MFSTNKIALYRNPVLDFCCIFQYGSKWKYESMPEIWEAMLRLKRDCVRDGDSRSSMSVVITLDQTIEEGINAPFYG